MSKTTLFDSRIRKYAYREAAQIYKDIGASPDGLSTEQVDAMQEKYGANSFAGRKNDTTLRRLRRAFINPFNVILFILGIISLVTDVFLASDFSKNASTAIIIFSMILISGTIRLIQELRAKNAAQQLDRLIHESITVRRSGELLEIPAEKLVVGDVVLLSAGDRVPADIRLTKVTDLFVSQAAITGESAILEKSSRTLGYGSPETLTQLANLAFMATTVISGKGEGIVLAVGKDTLYGSFTKPDAEEKTSFQQGANSIAWVMLRFIAVLIPFVFILLGITGGKWLQSFAFALSVAVGLMPEMLPMVITACLARGSLSMSRKQTIIKDINAMQGFGSMDVLCMDKTGTLTNESILLEYYMDVLGNESGEVLDLAFLNSIYHSGVRNPIDNAIRACQTMPGREVHFAQLLAGHQKADEIPFDYARKIVSTLVTAPNGENQLIMKGDIAHVVSRCGYVAYRGKVLPMEDAKESVSSVVDEMLQDGMKVIAVGKVSVYPRDGAYQLYCVSLTVDGVGDLYVAFEQLKKKLAAQGLFDPAHKKPLPRYPGRIGIITSSAGAAVHDMLRILNKRYPLSKVYLLPVRVQGAQAPGEIVSAIRYANYYQLADLLIVGRGGGSIEDLWAFNDEQVALAIYHSQIPVISAVGHEPDVTISDYVADLRAATPSNAAELAVPDQDALRQSLDAQVSAMAAALTRQIKASRQHLNALAASPALQSPTGYLEQKGQQLLLLKNRLISAQNQSLAARKQKYIAAAAKLDAMSPLKVLTRGYSMTRKEDGTVVRSVSQTEIGERVRISLEDGTLCATVMNKEARK